MQALEIVGRADVHRIGQGGDGGMWLVILSGEEARQAVVGIVGQHNLTDRQAAATCQQAGDRIAEVAGRHHQIQRAAAGAPVM